MKAIGFVVTAGIGAYFTINTFWRDYLTLHKKKSLSLLNFAVCCTGAVSLGVMMGAYFHGSTNLQIIKPKMKFISHFQILLGLCFLYFITVEQLERNILYWGSGILVSIA
jgi:hypothetical protein